MKNTKFLFAIVLAFSLFLPLEIFSEDAKNADSLLLVNVLKKITKSLNFAELNINSIESEINKDSGINAYAQKKKSGKDSFSIIITKGMMDGFIVGDEDRLALIVGHELAHITLKHTSRNYQNKTDLLRTLYTREEEYAADALGLQYTLSAGFSFQKAIQVIKAFIDKNLEYSSFEGLKYDHPSWKERLAMMDKEQSKLWKSMSAFENGVFFLTIEQFSAAEFCFRSVIKEFPGSFEAWANLGYALLMQYCDALEPEDLEKFNIGALVTSGFYRRPASMESQVRGINEDLWWDGVGALREAVRLNNKLSLAFENLGIAYMIAPQGKDAGKSAKYFDEALNLVEQDTSLGKIEKFSLFLNAGVANFSSGDDTRCKEYINKAEALYNEIFAHSTWEKTTNLYSQSLEFNKAFLKFHSNQTAQKKEAKLNFENYLKISDKNSNWWVLGHNIYKKLCSELGLAETKNFNQDNKKFSILKPVTSVKILDSIFISISDDCNDLKMITDKMENTVISVAQKSNLKRTLLTNLGIELLTSDKVIAIFMNSNFKSSIEISSLGLNSKKRKISIGMSLENFEKQIEEEKDNYSYRQIFDVNTNYRFYKNIGLAVKINKKNKTVEELVIAQIPESKTNN